MQIFIITVLDQTKNLTGKLGSESCSRCYPASWAVNGMYADLMPAITGQVPQAWISFTLPETILIPRVKVFTYYVSYLLADDFTNQRKEENIS